MSNSCGKSSLIKDVLLLQIPFLNIVFGRNINADVDDPKEVLSRPTRDLELDSEKEDVVYLLDFLVEKLLLRVIRHLVREKHLVKKSPTGDIARYILNGFVKHYEPYKVLTKQKNDTFGIFETFNKHEWWNEQTYKTTSDSSDSVSILDLFLETFLRDVFKWLCKEKSIYSKKSVNQLTEIAMEFIKTEKFYAILAKENKDDSLGIFRIIDGKEWWLKRGTIEDKDNTKQWRLS